ncbi:MAG: replication-associated recombination protein A [Rhodobacteraceae bacterium]|nr:replication-associated recombination protein A [Paracoccaceae bacterium]
MPQGSPTALGFKFGRSEDSRPLADILRPTKFEDVFGQQHLLTDGGPLRRLMTTKTVTSLIFWGPPGCGKTTLARLLAANSDQELVQMSAVESGTADLRRIFSEARLRRQDGIRTLIFVDEIHRFNRSQQDGFLPGLEDGSFTLIAATAENPSFELNPALLSRMQVLPLHHLTESDLDALLCRAEKRLNCQLPVTAAGRVQLIQLADGDGRALINLAEQIWLEAPDKEFNAAQVAATVARRSTSYDRSGDWHYNLISALHKSVRSSDPDAALYWLARMLHGGEDPRYILRRVTRMATEDIGLADPQTLSFCLAAWENYERLGSPEGELGIAEAVAYLALSPKSNTAYKAFSAAQRDARSTGSLPPPKHILNAPTKLMKEFGYGADYQYDHDSPDAFSGQNCFPDGMERKSYLMPVERGFERDLKKRLQYFAKLRSKRRTS